MLESAPTPLLVLSDVHLSPATPGAIGKDLARVIAAHPGHELILAGDVFDLSFAPALSHSPGFLSSLLERSPDVVAAIRNHAAQGNAVTLIPGNHDAALSENPVASTLLGRMELQESAPLGVQPWFVRRGRVHVEHGHVYDPDNAPVHPLSASSDRTEPLGIALTRRFVVPTGAAHFAHAQDSTPVSALARAFREYGPRAPSMIASYFRTALELCVEAGEGLLHHAAKERDSGEATRGDFAESVSLPPSVVADVLASVPRPTHMSRRDIFLRLYFDRVFATLVTVGAVSAIPRIPAAGWVALASSAFLAGSLLRGKDPYGALPEERLRAGAARIREITAAETVVFGHTHREVTEPGYVNGGSFAFPRAPGRPYVVVDPGGRAEIRRITAAAP